MRAATYNPSSLEQQVQQFGFLLIVNADLELVAISEKVYDFVDSTVTLQLGGPFEEVSTILFGDFGKRLYLTAQKLLTDESPRQLLEAKFNNKKYYFQICRYKDHILLEWEKQIEEHISATQMNEMIFLFEYEYKHSWSLLCTAIQNLLGYDKVFILQVDETGYSKSIGGSVSVREAFSPKTFSQKFMSNDIIAYYSSATYRYIPNVNQLSQTCMYTEDAWQPLFISKVFPLPALHEQYIKTTGITSMVTFPLMIHGRFWGMVVAQNKVEKKIDQQRRKLCTFVTQNAVAKYENLLKQGLLDINNQISNIENELQNNLETNKTVNYALVQSMGILMQETKSSGVAIFHQGDMFFTGDCPHQELFTQLIHFFQNHMQKIIFKDHNFRLRHHHHFREKLPFAGVMFLNISHSKDHYIVWFRPETTSSVVQFTSQAISDKAREVSEEKKTLHIYEEKIHDSAIPWNDQELYFVESLQRIINESIVRKAQERQLLTEELLSLNNELEMLTFTLSHDLKNPLSTLKMGLQFLSNSSNSMAQNRLEQWYKNLLGSIESMEDIISNMVQLSNSKVNTFAKDPIPMAYTIHKIASDAQLLYNNSNCAIHFGPLLPIWGEKSAIYQVFLNTIGNAIKYTSKNTEPQVWIESYQKAQNIYYHIKDNGIGIPSHDIKHIFDMFIRAENAKEFQGTGVGLSLVKRIMDRLGGSIKVQSTPSQGTEIILSFPLLNDFSETMLSNSST